METYINKLVEQYKVKKKALEEPQSGLDSYNELIRIKTNESFKFYKNVFENLYFKDGETFANYVKNYHNMEVKNVECYEGESIYGCLFDYNGKSYDIRACCRYNSIVDTKRIGKIELYEDLGYYEKIGKDSKINVLLEMIKS